MCGSALHREVWRPRAPNELEGAHHVVGYFMFGSNRHMTYDYVRDDEHISVEANYVMSTNESTVLLAAGPVGMGVFMTAKFMVHPYLQTGALQQVMPDWIVEPMAVHVVYPPNRHLSNKLRFFY